MTLFYMQYAERLLSDLDSFGSYKLRLPSTPMHPVAPFIYLSLQKPGLEAHEASDIKQPRFASEKTPPAAPLTKLAADDPMPTNVEHKPEKLSSLHK